MSSPVTTFCEHETLLEPCRKILRRLDEQDFIPLGSAIRQLFDRRRDECVDFGGTIVWTTADSSNPIGPLIAVQKLGSDGKPIERADSEIGNVVELAFKLWREKDAEFVSVIDRYGLAVVFAFIGTWSGCEDRLSLIRLIAFLGEITRLESETNKANKLESLRAAREQRNQNRAQESAETKYYYCTAAHDYIIANPEQGYDAMIAFLIGLPSPLKDKNGKIKRAPAESTIRRLVAGVRDAALSKLRSSPRSSPSLYATDHIRKRRLLD